MGSEKLINSPRRSPSPDSATTSHERKVASQEKLSSDKANTDGKSELDSHLFQASDLACSQLLEKCCNEDIKIVEKILNVMAFDDCSKLYSDLLIKHFGSSSESQPNDFLERMTKLGVFIQRYIVLVSLYANAAFNVIFPESMHKKYTFANFKASLVEANISYWEPGKHFMPCCLCESCAPPCLNYYTSGCYIDLSLDQVFSDKIAKSTADFFTNNETSSLFLDILVKLRNVCFEGLSYIHKEHIALWSMLKTNQPASNNNLHEIFVEFLQTSMNAVYSNLVDSLIASDRLNCINITCINPTNEHFIRGTTLKNNMLKKITGKLNSSLGMYFSDNMVFVKTLLDEVFKQNQWSSSSTPGDKFLALVEKHFKDNSKPSEKFEFLRRIKKLAAFITNYHVSAGLYADAAFKILCTPPGDYSLSDFQSTLVNVDVCYWEPGQAHCLCCLFTKRATRTLENFKMKENCDKATLFDQLFVGKLRKQKKLLLQDDEQKELFIDALLQLRRYCVESTNFIRKEYDELPKLLRLSEIVFDKDKKKTHYEVFIDFLTSMAGKVYSTITNSMIRCSRLDCLELACMNPYDEGYKQAKTIRSLVMKKSQAKMGTSESKEVKRSSRKIAAPHPASEEKSKQQTPTTGSDKATKVKISEEKSKPKVQPDPEQQSDEATKVKLMSLNLQYKIDQLKKLFEAIPNILESHKASTEVWIKKTGKMIESVQCSIHGSADCDVCLKVVPEQKFERFKTFVKAKADTMEELKSTFEACYLCVNKILHEKHAIDLDNLVKDDETEALLQKIQSVDERIALSQKMLDNFVSCCGKIGTLYEETVPDCCEFHTRWERIQQAARKAQHKPAVNSKKQYSLPKKKETVQTNKLEVLYSEAQMLENEFQNILKSLTLQSETMKSILTEIPRISANYSCPEIEQVQKVQEEIVEHGHRECQVLHEYLHSNITLVTQRFASDLVSARARLNMVKEKYSLFLGSCDALKKMHRDINCVPSDNPAPIFSEGLKLHVVPDGNLFQAIGLQTGHEAEVLQGLVRDQKKKSGDLANVGSGTSNEVMHGDIEVLQRFFDRPIVVVMESGPPLIFGNCLSSHADPIFLYISGNRCDALIVVEGHNSIDILEELVVTYGNINGVVPPTSCCDFHNEVTLASNSGAVSQSNLLSQYLPSFMIEELCLDACDYREREKEIENELDYNEERKTDETFSTCKQSDLEMYWNSCDLRLHLPRDSVPPSEEAFSFTHESRKKPQG